MDGVVEQDTKAKKTFRHMVISGGHVLGLNALGAIQKCVDEKVVDLCHIESIHGTSTGSILAVILILKPDLKDIMEYFIGRPWHNVIKKYDVCPLNLYNNSGAYDVEFINDLFKPIFDAYDIPLDITLGDFYEATKVELFIYVTELNAYVTESLSYKTHPSWRLLDAVYASCCIPIAFVPLIIEDKCYVDGGFIMNYPLGKCIGGFADLDEVLGISLGHMPEGSISKITKDMNIVDFASTLLMKIYQNALFPHGTIHIPYELRIESVFISMEYIIKVMNSSEERSILYKYGYDYMTKRFEEDGIWKDRR